MSSHQDDLGLSSISPNHNIFHVFLKHGDDSNKLKSLQTIDSLSKVRTQEYSYHPNERSEPIL